ncbi:hypothetical protein [Hyphococcus sp.]|uniref:hypothetical protein n=1 Tax=Hyphococcus sp. TaxID=2038636 RepID=UPI0035C72456
MAPTSILQRDDIIDLAPHLDALSECPVQFRYYCGLDIGRRDFTVLTVIQEKTITHRDSKTTEFVVVDIKKFKRGADYLAYADDVATYFRHNAFQLNEYKLTVDASGVGAPICEYLSRAHPWLKFRPVIITSGDNKKHNRYGRNWLILNLRNYLATAPNFFISSDLSETPEFRRQLESVEIKETMAGNTSYVVPGNDDHLLSMALAVIDVSQRAKVKSGTTDLLFSNLS